MRGLSAGEDESCEGYERTCRVMVENMLAAAAEVASKKGCTVAFENHDFILLVKRTRQKFGVSIDEAHDMIFADEETRRLVAWRINHDQECRKQALWDIRHKGSESRFVRDGDRINFRRSDGQRHRP